MKVVPVRASVFSGVELHCDIFGVIIERAFVEATNGQIDEEGMYEGVWLTVGTWSEKWWLSGCGSGRLLPWSGA